MELLSRERDSPNCCNRLEKSVNEWSGVADLREPRLAAERLTEKSEAEVKLLR